MKWVKEEGSGWLVFIGPPFTFFMIFLTITSWIHELTDWSLIPIFENTINGFREFAKFIFETLFYQWVSALLSYLYFNLFVWLSNFTPLVPYVPDLTVPNWIKEAAVLSIVLLRAQTQATRRSAPVTTLSMSEDEKSEWDTAIGQRSIAMRSTVQVLWAIVLCLYGISKTLAFPFKMIKFKQVQDWIRLFFGGALLLGLAYFVHDLIAAVATSEIENRHVLAHRSFVRNTLITLLMALLASLFFFFINGNFIVE